MTLPSPWRAALGGLCALNLAACGAPPSGSGTPPPSSPGVTKPAAPAAPAARPDKPVTALPAKPPVPAKPTASTNESKTRPSAPALPELDVPALLAQASHLKGRQITLTGTWAGWSGNCQGGPPISRSDWMIEDRGTGTCVYASGPAPQGIPMPPQAASMGLPVRVVGVVKLTPDGRPYLRTGVQP